MIIHAAVLVDSGGWISGNRIRVSGQLMKSLKFTFQISVVLMVRGPGLKGCRVFGLGFEVKSFGG